MSDVVIRVENLSKHYRLGTIGGATLREDMQRWWAQLRGKPDPLAPLDGQGRPHGTDHWALRDVSFEVKRGEVLGIIGRNGAGKSTLLKILSRTTAPTSGRAMVSGRIGSLLEVGTGFHPELTGRENIYLNGSILGMRKAEIDRKIDEIIDFSGVERFIDTPVKRYSSGMYVRLAFAVAAHLEPEILIIDEVLAVGDAEFQNKCLGKMHEISGSGRTVLFVSHNISAIKSICSNGLLLTDGRVGAVEGASKVAALYLGNQRATKPMIEWTDKDRPGNEFVKLANIRVARSCRDSINDLQVSALRIEMALISTDPKRVIDLGIIIHNSRGETVLHTTMTAHGMSMHLQQGENLIAYALPESLLIWGDYFLSVSAAIPNQELIFYLQDLLSFHIPVISMPSDRYYPNDAWRGALSPQIGSWCVEP